MYLEKVRSFSPNFGLYKVIEVHDGDRIMDSNGRTLAEEIRIGMVVGVQEIDFVGAAKGKTGRHKINETNTDIIVGADLKKRDGKYNVHKWVLLNQDELDEKYGQYRRYNAGILG